MAQQRTYADGTALRDGDVVLIERGSVLGRVSEVIDSPEHAAENRLQGRGIVVDAQPKGFVFLSDACLAEDPPQFVRRGPSEKTRQHAAIVAGAGTLLLLPILYSLGSAMYSAFSTGQVMVVRLGWYTVKRELVTWHAGWARFVGPILLLVSLLAFDGTRGASLRWWLAAGGTALSLALLAYSGWFTSVGRAVFFMAAILFLFLAHQIDKKFGRAAALAFMLSCVGLFVWKVVGAT